MGLITEKITYNVKERGRKHLGQDRNLDTVALARLINSPAVQEQVKAGDMLGYYGHWPRQVFGMETREGGVLDGKAVPLPIAIRTIFLNADDDGNITHQEEFLDTDAGQIAQKMWESKAGGFSSAIIPVAGTSPIVPRSWHGFDMVHSPNYHGNRGYPVNVLDSLEATADQSEAMMLFDAVGSAMDTAKHLGGLLDATSAQLIQALEALERSNRDVDLLVGRLAAGGGGVLDDILGEGVQPLQGRRVPDFARFADRPLVPLQTLPEEKAPAPDGVMTRYGLS